MGGEGHLKSFFKRFMMAVNCLYFNSALEITQIVKIHHFTELIRIRSFNSPGQFPLCGYYIPQSKAVKIVRIVRMESFTGTEP